MVERATHGMEGIDQMLIGQQMIKRQGTMHDLANMCLFLCSDAASFVTGQTILVDGGYTKKPSDCVDGPSPPTADPAS